MAKANLCVKCGSKLDEKTGKCPNCDSQPNNSKKRKSKKKLVIIALIVVLLLTGGTGALVYFDILDFPLLNDWFISMQFKDGEKEVVTTAKKEKEKKNNDLDEDEEDYDLGDNYEVPEFDAEKYFRDNTTLKSTVDIASASLTTESDVYQHFSQRGFNDCLINYEYDTSGNYTGVLEASNYGSAQHPMYHAYYTTANGLVWMLMEVNGSFYASPLSYNYDEQTSVEVIFSETDTITSYDSTTNKFYINVPNSSKTVIKTIAHIDAATLEQLTNEEIAKR